MAYVHLSKTESQYKHLFLLSTIGLYCLRSGDAQSAFFFFLFLG